MILWCEAAGMLAAAQALRRAVWGRRYRGRRFRLGHRQVEDRPAGPRGRRPFEVLHIGDLDRHGESIFDVLSADVAAFDEYEGNVIFTRIAVTRDQIALHNLPTDPDHPDIVQAEALPPDVLADIVDCGDPRAP